MEIQLHCAPAPRVTIKISKSCLCGWGSTPDAYRLPLLHSPHWLPYNRILATILSLLLYKERIGQEDGTETGGTLLIHSFILHQKTNSTHPIQSVYAAADSAHNSSKLSCGLKWNFCNIHILPCEIYFLSFGSSPWSKLPHYRCQLLSPCDAISPKCT